MPVLHHAAIGGERCAQLSRENHMCAVDMRMSWVKGLKGAELRGCGMPAGGKTSAMQSPSAYYGRCQRVCATSGASPKS